VGTDGIRDRDVGGGRGLCRPASAVARSGRRPGAGLSYCHRQLRRALRGAGAAGKSGAGYRQTGPQPDRPRWAFESGQAGDDGTERRNPPARRTGGVPVHRESPAIAGGAGGECGLAAGLSARPAGSGLPAAAQAASPSRGGLSSGAYLPSAARVMACSSWARGTAPGRR